jgi:hypothetical protein
MHAHGAYAQSVLARDEVTVEHTACASAVFVSASPRARVHEVGLFRFEDIVHDHRRFDVLLRAPERVLRLHRTLSMRDVYRHKQRAPRRSAGH